VIVATVIRGAGESDVDGEEGRCFWQLLPEEENEEMSGYEDAAAEC
jgi:hypothetical protein